jgi:hypothetical protein
VRSTLGLSSYPTGVVDRTTGILSRSTWYSQVNSRNSVPATVAISMTRSFNRTTRDFSANIDFTALQALNGQYNFNVILVEDGIVWTQAGALGGPNYVHDWTVRAMMNGALGEEVINGSWTQGMIINRSVNYNVPVPTGGGPDIVFDSCSVVVLVYEVGSPLNSNAEIQQAIQDVLISPDYVASISPVTPDVIADNTTPATFDVAIYNEGLMTDTYGIDLTFTGPAGWTQEYTTVNGTYPAGHVDSVQVSSGDTTTITVTVNPNGFDGYGATDLEFLSGNNPSNGGSALLRNVTTTGVDILVIDAEDEDSETFVMTSLDNVFAGSYGVVSRTSMHDTTVNIGNFDIVKWCSGQSTPAFYPEEVNHLESYLDNGGRLFISGQDIGSDIFEVNGQSQFAQSFYNNYLHANYLNNSINTFLINGVSGDPITNGVSFVVTYVPTGLSLEGIGPYDASATPILTYMNGPNVGAIKVSTNNYRLVYSGIGFEQISDEADRDSIMTRSIRWLNTDLTGIEQENTVPLQYALDQNYPNPFNPGTYIKYTIANQSNVQLKVYNNLGQEIRTLVNNLTQSVNQYSVYWDGKDNAGNSVTSGVYYYKLISNSSNQRFEQSRKMILIK